MNDEDVQNDPPHADPLANSPYLTIVSSEALQRMLASDDD